MLAVCAETVSLKSRQWHASVSQCYPGSRHGIPNQQACLVCTPNILLCTVSLELHVCQFSEGHSVNIYPYSNPALGRSARFESAWSGGEVELISMINSGLEQRSCWWYLRCRPGPKPHHVVVKDIMYLCIHSLQRVHIIGNPGAPHTRGSHDVANLLINRDQRAAWEQQVVRE